MRLSDVTEFYHFTFYSSARRPFDGSFLEEGWELRTANGEVLAIVYERDLKNELYEAWQALKKGAPAIVPAVQ